MSDGRETPELNELEAALGGLTPRPLVVDRDALMYRAGRAAVRRWQWATVAATAVVAVLALALGLRPPMERLVYVPAAVPRVPTVEILSESPSDPAPPSAESGLAAYYRLQEQVLSRGLDGLPPLSDGPDPTGPVSTEKLLRDL